MIAAGAAAIGRRVRTSDVVETARAETVLPPPASTAPTSPGSFGDVRGLSPYVTPNDDFYRIDTALSVPQVDVGSWTLFVEGMVDEPYGLTYDELVDMSDVEEVVTLSCVSNEVGGHLVGNAVWQGVPLATCSTGPACSRARRRSSAARSTASRPGSRPRSASTAGRRSSPWR